MNDPRTIYTQAISAFNHQEWQVVIELAGPLLKQAPAHPGLNFIAGVAALEQGHIADALTRLQHAVALDPQRADYAAHLARALSMANQPRQARLTALQAAGMAPTDAVLLDMIGTVFISCLEHERAVAVFSQAVALMPTHLPFRYNLAAAFVGLGNADAAEQEVGRCLKQDPKFWRAHLMLAHLNEQTLQSNHVSRLEHLLQEAEGAEQATICINMALAKEYEDLAIYDKAFSHLTKGKQAGASFRRYMSAHDAKIFDALQRAIPDVQAKFHPGHVSNEPIFIFGMPRSGTTLVERILSSHPDVQSAGELQTFGLALRGAWNTRVPLWDDPSIAQRTRNVDWHRVGAAYLSAARPEMDGKHYFVDKLPHNFLYAGFIALAFPNAKLICVRRNALDTCLGNFRQLFAEKLPYYDYSHNLLDIGRYYVEFDRLLRHWQKVLPGRILEIKYESVVDAPEAATRALLQHIGLAWSDEYRNFVNNDKAVLTASALQVREPIHHRAVDRWCHYEPYLRELKDLLQESGIDPATCRPASNT